MTAPPVLVPQAPVLHWPARWGEPGAPLVPLPYRQEYGHLRGWNEGVAWHQMDSTIWAAEPPPSSDQVERVIRHVRRQAPPDVEVVPTGWDLADVTSLPLSDSCRKMVQEATRALGKGPLPKPLTTNVLLSTGFTYGAVAELLAVLESAGYLSTCQPTPTTHHLTLIGDGLRVAPDPSAVVAGTSLLAEWIEDMVPSERAVYISISTRSPDDTLASLASGHGITHNALRRCVDRLDRHLRGRMDRPGGGPVRFLVSALRSRLGASAPPEILEGEFGGSSVPLSVAVRLAGPYRYDRYGWLVNEWHLPEPDIAAATLDRALDRLDRRKASQSLKSWGLRAVFHDDWLRLRYEFFVGHMYARRVRAADRAVVALESLGRPASTASLIGWITDHDADPKRLSYALSTSPLIMRVGKRRWALASWGLDPYITAVDALVAILEGSASQRMSIDELIAKASERHRIPASTIMFYVSGSHPMFRRDADIVSLRSDPDYVPAAGGKVYQGAYLLEPGVISLGAPIDENVRRGSGKAIGSRAGAHLNLRPGDTRWFYSADGEQVRVGWNIRQSNGATRGSLKRAVRSCDAADGEAWVTVVLGASGTAEISIVDPSDLEPGRWESVAALTGIPYDPTRDSDHDMWERLANAIGEWPSPKPVINRLLARRDSLVASMCPPHFLARPDGARPTVGVA